MEKTFPVDGFHFEETGPTGLREKLSGQASQGGGFSSSENAGSPSEVEFVDGLYFQQGPKESWPALANQGAESVVLTQNRQHGLKEDGLSAKNPEIGEAGQLSSDAFRHEFRGENQRGSRWMIKRLSLLVNVPVVTGNDRTGFRRLSAGQTFPLEARIGKPHGHMVHRYGAGSGEKSVPARPNDQQPSLVFRAGEAGGGALARGDLSIRSESKIGDYPGTDHRRKG